jgi:hypothetical protein
VLADATRIVREMDALISIALHLDAKERTELPPGIDFGPQEPLPPLPENHGHVLAVLSRARLADEQFKFVLGELRDHYEKRGYFGPRQMLLVEWRLHQNAIAHEPGNFVVSIRSVREIEQVRGMDAWRRGRLRPYLSFAQRGRFCF